MGYGSEGITERFQWTFPIIFSPVDKKTLYTSSQHIWKTTNGGQTWTRISPDLSRHDPKTMGASGGPITRDNTGVETYGVVFTIAPTPQDINTIWAGSDDGLVHVTRNGGQNWDNVTPKDLPEFARISLIEASPHTNGTAYVAANRYQMDDMKPYVYKTTDFGKTWTKIVNGVKDTHFARQIREDHKKKGLLYLGTENGIYVSFDDGANWQSLQLNLPDTSDSRPAGRPIATWWSRRMAAASGSSTTSACCGRRRRRSPPRTCTSSTRSIPSAVSIATSRSITT